MQPLAYLLPVFSGMMDAAARGAIKLTRAHRLTLIAGGFFAAVPFYAVWLVFQGVPRIGPGFWPAIIFHLPLFLLANVLIVEAHRSGPLIETVPYTALVPALQLVVTPAAAALGIIKSTETPTWWGFLGVLIIASGVYLLNAREGQLGLLDPFRALLKKRGARLMFAVSVIFSMTSVADYVAFKNANESFYLLVDHGLTGVATVILAAVYWDFGRVSWKELSPRGSVRGIALYGVLVASAVIPHMLAFRWITVVPYVIAGKRAGAILFAVVLGLVLAARAKTKGQFAEEAQHLKFRIPGVLVIVTGMLIIILWGKG